MGRYYLRSTDRTEPVAATTHEDAMEATHDSSNTTETDTQNASSGAVNWAFTSPSTDTSTSQWATTGYAASIVVTAGATDCTWQWNGSTTFNRLSSGGTLVATSGAVSGTTAWTGTGTFVDSAITCAGWSIFGGGSLAATDAITAKIGNTNSNTMKTATLTIQLDNDNSYFDVPWTVSGGGSNPVTPYIGGGYYG
jgi:hypothetical protein